MSEEDESTGEVEEREIIGGVVFVADDQPSEVLQPGKVELPPVN
jgi:hypothetical protein